ncbi:MAG: enoyl-CoA hydratase/isomerase family protein [Phycisphaerales bacterium]
MTDLATLTLDGSVATLSLNRPDARNALSLDLLAALHARLDDLARAPIPPTVLTVTGTGKSFCAGMDLKAVLGDNATAQRLLMSLADFTLRLRALPCVTLAKVNGAAIGGGCGLATVCDLAITHADSKMGFPEVDLGVCPAVVAPWLVRKVGGGRARAILLRGGLMSGQHALACGIVNECVPTRDELDAAAAAIATRLAQGGPAALRATKALLNELDGSNDAALVRRGAELSAQVLATPEAQATLRAKLAGPPGG